MSAVGITLIEWAEAATVHGVQYIFTAGQVISKAQILFFRFKKIFLFKFKFHCSILSNGSSGFSSALPA